MGGREPWALSEEAASWPPAREPKEGSRPVTASDRFESASLRGAICPDRPRRSSAVADGAGESCSGGTLKACPALFRNGLLGPLAASPAQCITH